jgi:hypothetical protein
MNRTRRSAAVLCLFLVALAVFLPAAAPLTVYATLISLGVFPPDLSAVIAEFAATTCDEQPVALLALDTSRAPPVRF